MKEVNNKNKSRIFSHWTTTTKQQEQYQLNTTTTKIAQEHARTRMPTAIFNSQLDYPYYIDCFQVNVVLGL